MLRLEKANGKNVWKLLKLRVSDDQRGFVASNDTSIIEAYTAITGNGYAFPFGIYALFGCRWEKHRQDPPGHFHTPAKHIPAASPDRRERRRHSL